MKHTLEIDSVILEFGSQRVLQDVYLKSETGKVSGLLGRNGSGKTCLLKIIYGDIEPTDRSIRLDGVNSMHGLHHPETMRYLPQGKFIPGSLSLKRIFLDFRLDFSCFIEAFPEFEKYFNTSLKKLSSGEKRVVEIYSILTSESRFCMLDEPFSHVMPLHIDAIKFLIMKEKENKGILVTDHLYEHVIDICDDLYVLNQGKTSLTKSIQDLETLGYLR